MITDAQGELEGWRADYTDFDAAPAAYLVLDRHGVIAKANLEAAFMLGKSREQLVGVPFPLCTSLNAHALRAHLREGVRDRSTAQLRLMFDDVNTDVAAPLVQLTSNPILDERGVSTGCRTLLTPLDALGDHLKILDAIVAVSDGVAMASADERTLLTIAANLIVPSLADACAFRIARDDDERHADLVVSAGTSARCREAACAERPVTLSQAAAFIPAATTSGIDCVVAPLAVPGGTAHGTLALACAWNGKPSFASDLGAVTRLAARCARAIERGRRERRLESALEWRNRLLSMVVHDLRNPLTVLGLAVGKLLDVPAGFAASSDRRRGRRQLETLSRGVARMTRMVNDLADFAALEAGHLNVAPEPCEARKMIAEIVEAAMLAAETKGIRIDLELAPSAADCVVHCDRERIAQVFGNLLDNAMKFTARGGSVEVRCTGARDALCIDVTDSGCGIEPSVAASLFRPYAQARKTAKHGRGLGLFISRGIVEAHGGTLALHATEAGRGSTFRLTLPVR